MPPNAMINVNARLLRLILIGLLALMPSLSRAQDLYDVQFGSLYGADHDTYPTQFLSGTGPLDPLLFGRDFFVICLQEDMEEVYAPTAMMYASASSDVLTAGIWGGLTASERDVMTNASRNIYYNNIAQIASDTSGERAGLSFQFATWYITSSFQAGEWSGELTAEKIAEAIIPYGLLHFNRSAAQNAQIEAYVYTALLDTPGEIFFLQSPDNPFYQPFAIVVIPEPSTVMLTAGAFGAMIIGLRRRKS